MTGGANPHRPWLEPPSLQRRAVRLLISLCIWSVGMSVLWLAESPLANTGFRERGLLGPLKSADDSAFWWTRFLTGTAEEVWINPRAFVMTIGLSIIWMLIVVLCHVAAARGVFSEFFPSPAFRRYSAGRCPRCGYNLRAQFDAGCPECGWRRSEA